MTERDARGNSLEEQTVTLIGQLRDGGPEAASLLDRLYRGALLRFCWGYLGQMDQAEDALQDVWYKVLTAPSVPETFRPWLYKLARNHCLNLLRQRRRHRAEDASPLASHLHQSATGHLTRLVKDERRAQLAELLKDLPEAQQEVLRLRYVEGLSRGEIAEVLEISEALVKSRLFEALKRLRTHTSLLEER